MMTTRRFFRCAIPWLLALSAPGAIAATVVDTLPLAPIVRTSVALFDLECDDIPPTALRILTDVIRAELVRSDRFALIDRAHVQKILAEQKFQHAGIVTEATMVQMGELIGAKKIVTGRIGWLGKVRVITLQLIDVATGRVDQLEATDFVGEVEHMRRPVRAATQRLIGIGGFLDLQGGFIHIVSRPLGATVHVSGLYEGTTPVQVWVDSIGSFPVKVMHPGYQDWVRHVHVESGETTFLEPALVSLTPSDISMSSTPPGANVYVYGRFQGKTPVKVRVDSAGVYDVQMTHDDFHAWKEMVQVRIGEDLSVKAQLVPIEVIKLTSSPTGVSIYVNSKFVGNTPTKLRVGAAGNYTMQLKKDGYHDWNQVVKVRPGETPTVHAAIRKIVIESKYVQTGRPALWGFMMPYSVAASEALIYSVGVKSQRPYIGAVLVGVPVAYFGMLKYTTNRDISAPRTSMIVSSGMWGAAWGVMGAVAARPERKPGKPESDLGPRMAAGLGVVASTAAIFISANLTEKYEVSGRRVAAINLGGFLGSVMGVGFPYLFDASGEAPYFASLVAGGVTGVLYSIYATRGMGASVEKGKRAETSEGWHFMQPVVTMTPTFGSLRSSPRGSPDPMDLRYGVKLAEYRF
jgi:hypothetical protein